MSTSFKEGNDLGHFLLFLMTIFLVGCSSMNQQEIEVSELEIVLKDSTLIQLPDSGYVSGFDFKVFERNDSLLAWVPDFENRRMHLISLEFGIYLSTLYLGDDLVSPIYRSWSFLPINNGKDLIIATGLNQEINRSHECVLKIIDREGRLKNCIPLINPLLTHKDSVNRSNKYLLISQHTSSFIEKDDRYYFSVVPMVPSYIGDTEFNRSTRKAVAISNKSGELEILDVKYPLVDGRQFAGNMLSSTVFPVNQDEIIVSFGHVDSLYHYHIPNHSTKALTPIQKLISAPSSFEERMESIPERNYSSSIFSNIFQIDSAHFCRIGYLPSDSRIPKNQYFNYIYSIPWIGMYNFKGYLVAEGYIKNKFSFEFPEPHYFKGKCYAIKIQKRTDHVVIYSLGYNLNKLNVEKLLSYRDSVKEHFYQKEETLSQYLTRNDLSNDVDILYLPSTSCPSCFNKAVKVLIENFKEKNAFINIVTDDMSLYNNMNNIFPGKVKLDPERKIEEHVVISSANPTLINIRGAEIEKTLIFTPSSMDNFESVILAYFE